MTEADCATCGHPYFQHSNDAKGRPDPTHYGFRGVCLTPMVEHKRICDCLLFAPPADQKPEGGAQ